MVGTIHTVQVGHGHGRSSGPCATAGSGTEAGHGGDLYSRTEGGGEKLEKKNNKKKNKKNNKIEISIILRQYIIV